jgi:flagellar motor component MotA
MNEMMYMPLMWLIILGTAILSAVVTTALPSLPKYWNAFKSSIRRVFTRKSKMDAVDVIIIAKLQDKIDELEEQVNNLAEVLSTRDKNRKYNTRREVRDYLEELRK